MRILCKKSLCFSMMDGRRCTVKPFAVETVPDWVAKTKMWEFAMQEEGLISVLNDTAYGVGMEEGKAEETPTKAKKTRKKAEEVTPETNTEE